MDNETKNFTAEMERQFGSEQALGVVFKTDDGRTLLAEEWDLLCNQLGPRAPTAQSFFMDGLDACCCTYYASQIYRDLPGRVQIFGFDNRDNPSSRIARDQIHPGGHDFAIVDGRYIVDPWCRLVSGTIHQMVYDLQDQKDAVLAMDIYGSKENWTHIFEAEKFMDERIAHEQSSLEIA